jgi:hypothetical protein
LVNAEKFSTPAELIQGIAEKVLTPSLQKKAMKLIAGGASKIKGVKIAFF